MAFCPTCRSEFRPGFDRCKGCNALLVDALPEPPAHPPVSDPAFRTLYSTTELVDAIAIKALLEGRGIDAEVQNNYSGFSAIGIPTSAAPFQITVPSADADEAMKILREMVKNKPPRPASRRRGLWLLVAVLIGGTILLVLLARLVDGLGRR